MRRGAYERRHVSLVQRKVQPHFALESAVGAQGEVATVSSTTQAHAPQRERNQMADDMKILIAYDGKDLSDAALDDLRRAGLPDRAQALVLTVANVFLPPQTEQEEIEGTSQLHVKDVGRKALEDAQRAIEQASVVAERATERVRTLFPVWEVRPEAQADSPAWAIIKQSDAWKPDLVVVGALSNTVLGGRLILGSVSQRVLYEARCSVRVARGPKPAGNTPPRILIGTDGSPGAEAAVAAAANRAWPTGTEALLVYVLDPVTNVMRDPSNLSVLQRVTEADVAETGWVRNVLERSVELLNAAGIAASLLVTKGNPKSVLVSEAEIWGADSIFLGAKGIRGAERLLLGSVSAAVAARATCSVEVVRTPHQE